jgi:hypothetical protein
MFVEHARRGKRFWSQMVADGKSDFSERDFGGFISESRVIFLRFAVLIKRRIRAEKQMVGSFRNGSVPEAIPMARVRRLEVQLLRRYARSRQRNVRF